MSRNPRCTAATRAGKPCQNQAIHFSVPPRCGAHSGRIGAPTGNRNRFVHGFYARPGRPPRTRHPLHNIDDVVQDALNRHEQLSAYIDAIADTPIQAQAHLFALHAQSTRRLANLLRDRHALTHDASHDLTTALANALAELTTELQSDPNGLQSDPNGLQSDPNGPGAPQ